MDNSKRGKRKLSRTNVVIICALAVLIFAASFFAFLNYDSSADEPDGTIQINLKEESPAYTLSLEELRNMPAIEAEKEIVSSNKDNVSGYFQGVDVADLLNELNESWSVNYTKIVFTASDEYKSIVDVDEVLAGPNVLIAYSLNGEDLKRKDGGPVRVVVLNDEFGTRSIMYLTKIELE